MQFNELMVAFGAKLGGGLVLKPDQSGTVTLGVDDMTLTIVGIEEAGLVALSADVAEPPPEDRMEKLYRALLIANHQFTGTAGATLSIDPANGMVKLCKALPLALQDGDSFFAEVERFLNTLETWRKIISDFRGQDPDAEIEPQDASVSSESIGGLGGFMQV